jgi:hypothetical protein
LAVSPADILRVFVIAGQSTSTYVTLQLTRVSFTAGLIGAIANKKREKIGNRFLF